MNKFEKINLQVEIINYTTDRVFYYENPSEAIECLKSMRTERPNDEVTVAHFSICGIDVPFVPENIEFVEKNDVDEIVATMIYYENCYGIQTFVYLEDIQDDLENRGVVSFHWGTSEMEAFMNYCEEISLLCDIPEESRGYFDYEQMLYDYKCNGDIYELPCDNESGEKRYMFVY